MESAGEPMPQDLLDTLLFWRARLLIACQSVEHGHLLFSQSSAPGEKAKVRAIVLGYQDNNYQHRETSAPAPSKSGRHLYFQMAAWKRFQIKKSDISGAFLGRRLD